MPFRYPDRSAHFLICDVKILNNIVQHTLGDLSVFTGTASFDCLFDIRRQMLIRLDASFLDHIGDMLTSISRIFFLLSMLSNPPMAFSLAEHFLNYNRFSVSVQLKADILVTAQ